MADKQISINIRAIVQGLNEVKALVQQLVALQKVQAQANKTSSSIKNTGSTAAGAASDVGKLEDRFGGLNSTLRSAAQGLNTIGTTLTATITAPLIGAGVAATKFAGDLQQEVANIRSIRPDLDASRLFSTFNRLQTQVPQTSQQIASGFYNIVSSVDGVSEAVGTKLVTTFARGATAAQTDANTFGTAIIGTLKAFERNITEADHAADLFFNTVNFGVVEGAQLAPNLGNVAKSARTAGVTMEEMFALIAAQTQLGGDPAQNINNLSNLFAKITTEESQKQIRALGVVTTDASGKFRPILDVLTDLKGKLDGLSEEDRAKALQGIFPDFQARVGLSTAINQLEFTKKVLKENQEGAGAAERAFAVMSQTFNAQATILKNTVVAALTEIGAKLLPLLIPAIQSLSAAILPVVTRLIEIFSGLPTPIKIVVGVIVAALAALGPITLAVAALLPVIAAVAVVGGEVAAVVAALIPVLAALAAIIAGAVIGATVLWKNNFLGIQETTRKVFNEVRAFVLTALGEIQSAFDRILPSIQSIVQKGLNAIAGFWQRHGETIKNVIKTTWEVVTGAILFAINIITGVIETVVKLLDGDWQGAWNSSSRVVEEAVVKIGETLLKLQFLILKAWANIALSLLTAIPKAAIALHEAAVGLGKRIVDGIKDTIEGGIPAILSKLFQVATAMFSPGTLATFYLAGKAQAAARNRGFQENLDNQAASNDIAPIQTPSLVANAPDRTKEPIPSPPPSDTSNAPRTRLPAGFGGSKKGGGDSKTRKERFEPLDALEREQERQTLEDEKAKNALSLAELEHNLALKLVSVRTYFRRKKELADADAQAEITLREQELTRLRAKLASIPANASNEKRERDSTQAEIERAERELERLRKSKADISNAVDAEEVQRLREIEQQYVRNRQALFELQNQKVDGANDGQRLADQLGIEEEFGDQLKELRVELKAAQDALDEAKQKSDAAAEATYKSLVRSLSGNLQILEALKREREASSDLSQINRELDELARRRQLKEKDLADQIAFTGLSQEEAAQKRLEIERAYKQEVDQVIARLEALAKLSLNPEIQRLLDRLKSETSNLGNPTLDNQAEAARRRTEILEQRRQFAEADIQDRVNRGVLSEIRARQQMLELHRQTANEMLRALQAELAIAQAQKDPVRAAEIQRRMQLIKDSTREEEEFGAQLKATAENALESGLTQFFTDVLTGAKSAKEAALDFVRSFLAALIQLIVKLIVTKILMAALGFASGGVASGDFDGADVGEVKGFASGGGVQAKGGGHLIVVGEAGYDEMVLTTDPRHRQRTQGLLTQFVNSTGIFPAFARGGLASGNDILRRVSPRRMAAGGLIEASSIQDAPAAPVYLSQSITIQGVTNPQEWETSKQTVSRDLGRATQQGIRRVSS